MAPSLPRRLPKRIAHQANRSKNEPLLSISSDLSDQDYVLEESSSSEEEEEPSTDQVEDQTQDEAAETSGRGVRRARKRERRKPGRGEKRKASGGRRSRKRRKRRKRRRRSSSSSDEEYRVESSARGASRGREDERKKRRRKRRRSKGRESRREAKASVLERSRGTDVVRGDRKKKGKAKIDEGGETSRRAATEQDTKRKPATEQETTRVCGICLCEDGKAERGQLDCCDHYFCYGCIMEWAKVESRCPMCKQRFVTIVRPPVAGLGRRRTIRIPTRDQVYVHSEDENSGFEDPYADVVCMECQEAGEERLLLLCDHCDSAAHTYCVGLGRSIPRGDWFCQSCQALMMESSAGEDDDEDFILGFTSGDEAIQVRSDVAAAVAESRQMARRAATERPLSSSIRARSGRPGVRRRLLRRLTRPRNARVSGPRLTQPPRIVLTETSESACSHRSQESDRQAGPARTVPQQRMLQERIHVMREGIDRDNMEFTSAGRNVASSVQRATAPTEEVRSVSLQSESKSQGKLVASTEDCSRDVSTTVASTVPSIPTRQTTSGKQELNITQAWHTVEQSGTRLGALVATSGQQAPKALYPGLSSHNRQEYIESKHHASSPANVTVVVPHSNPDNAYVSPTASPRVNFEHEKKGKQTVFSGRLRSEKEAVQTNAVEEHPTTPLSQKCNVTSSSTVSCNLTVHKEDFDKQREEDFERPANPQSNACDSCGNKSVANMCVYGMKEGSGLLMGSKDTPLQFPNTSRQSGEKCKTGEHNGLVLQSSCSNAGSSFEANKHCVENVPMIEAAENEGWGSSDKREMSFPLNQKLEMVNTSRTNSMNSESCKRHDVNAFPHTGKKAQKESNLIASTSYAGRDERNVLHTSTYEQQQQQKANEASSSVGNAHDNKFLSRKRGKGAGVKGQVASMVKRELWPVYLSKGFGKEQFKEIARSATHTLLSLFDSEKEETSFAFSRDLSCSHAPLRGQSLIADCCDSCFQKQVQYVVRTFIEKIYALKI